MEIKVYGVRYRSRTHQENYNSTSSSLFYESAFNKDDFHYNSGQINKSLN